MKEINLNFELNNKENPYTYNGIATIQNNVIRYKDEDSHILFDIKRNVLIKKDNEKTLKLDFYNKIMHIKIGNNELKGNIEVLNITNKQNKEITITYVIDKNKIKLSLNINGGTYE